MVCLPCLLFTYIQDLVEELKNGGCIGQRKISPDSESQPWSYTPVQRESEEQANLASAKES